MQYVLGSREQYSSTCSCCAVQYYMSYRGLVAMVTAASFLYRYGALLRVAAIYTIYIIHRTLRHSSVAPHYCGSYVSAVPHYPGLVRSPTLVRLRHLTPDT